MTRALRSALRVGIAAGLTVYLLWKSHPRAVAAAAAGADWWPIAVAVLLVLIDRALMAYRWLILLATVDPAVRPPFRAVMRVFFVSTFIGTFLPASVGSDAVRAYGIARLNVDGADAVASVLMDRILGVASVLLMALAGLVLARDLAGHPAILAALGIAAAASGFVLALIFSRRAAAIAGAAIDRLPVARIREVSHRVLASVRRYASYRRALLDVLVCSVVVQVLRIVQAYYLGRGLGIAAPLSAYFAFVPLILLVMLLPITINGLGTSQAAFVWCFARVGVGAAPAFALSILFVALGVVGNLPGGALYAFGRGNREQAPGAAASTRT